MYMEIELMGVMKEWVEIEVIEVFVINLKDLLMVVLVGLRVIFGLDLGLWMGFKIVVVDFIGKVLVIEIIYLY